MKFFKKSAKKSVKGMTLIEVIIAMLVLGIMGSIMALIGAQSSRMMIATNHLNNKTEVEAPVAISRDETAAQKARNDPQGNAVTVPGVTDVGKIEVSSSKFSTYQYDVKRYSTSAVGDELGNSTDTNSMNGDLVFYVIN